MIKSFVFKNGRLVSKDLEPEMLRLVLYDADVELWVDLEAPAETETKAILESVFSFHPLAIEDCVAVSERPKVDDYETYLFFVLHAVDYSAHEFQTTELNVFVGKNFLVTYHVDPLRSVAAIMDRVLKNAAAVARAPDRLVYHLLDQLLENYQPALADLAKDIAETERNVMALSSKAFLERVLRLKGEVQRLRAIAAPQREVLSRIAHGEFRIVRTHLLPYYRDLLDRLARITDASDTYGESLNSLLQVHLNLQQMQVNQVIKVLTVLATLAMPLLVITSFYGMNLNHFPPIVGAPESWGWGPAYAWVFGVTGLTTVLIYLFLRKKRWM